ncbi:MAG: hypothetical protein CVT49_00635 [candidate division Zixibacteria bacterium HGW-Zixibacteria-1]|nr:MAG: hypothetical protein CVT49_00635 [candidate division Zixibacteria bacterium HGW-Zixibacteria-1]
MSIGTALRISGIGMVLLALLTLSAAAPQDDEKKEKADHNNVSCPQCHSFAETKADATAESRNRSDNCTGCHTLSTLEPSAYPLNFHNSAAGNCLDCHQFHKKAMIKAGSRVFALDFDSKSQLFQCLTCHNDSVSLDNLSAGHKTAAAVYHSDNPALTFLSPSEKCLICHSTRSDAFPDLVKAGLNPPSFDEHASHPFGVSAKAGGVEINEEKVVLYEGRIECQSCHEFENPKNGELAVFEYPGETCRVCHPH